ncbi:MAG TPA: O-antigen polymerase [Candidatus Polarisedimenticolaceae bacterium]|nr:O-antigen polymerase [Candidatus Polarisedimenticolaceae bacterium]
MMPWSTAASLGTSGKQVRILPAALVCLLAAALLPLVVLLRHPQVMALSIVILLPLVLVVAQRVATRTLDYFEILIPYSVLHLLSFGVGTYFLLENPKYLLHQSVYAYLVPALALSVVGYLAVVLGYHVCFPRLGPSRMITYRMRGLRPVLFLAALGLVGQTAGILLHRAVMLKLGLSGLYTALSHLTPLFLASWFLVWHLAWTSSKSRFWRFLGPVLLTPQIVYAMYGTIGGKSYTITLLAIPTVAYWYARRKLPVVAIIAVVLVGVLVVFPLYNTFRTTDRHLDTNRRLEQTLTRAQRWDGSEYVERSVEAFFVRLALVSSPAAVIRSVGRWEDYRHGSTLTNMFLAFIPRAIWPDKPKMYAGHEFGHTFGLLNPMDVETSVACTMVGELYWNFGVPGVLGWGFLVGGLFRWVYRRFGEGGRMDALRKALYVALLIQLLSLNEGDQGLLLPAVLETLVLYSGVTWVLLKLRWIERQEGPLPA